jgi:hypothetical protein
MENNKRKPYILECPWCGQKHLIDKSGEFLLNHPDKIFSVQCANSFGDGGCKKFIVICSQETILKLQNKKL